MTNWQQWLQDGDLSRLTRTRDRSAPARLANAHPSPAPATWQTLRVKGVHGTLSAQVLVPSLRPRRAPLLLLLHGCSQTAEQFARATAVAQHAERAGYVVVAAEQCVLRDPARCWSWYDAAHQQRGSGEPALLVEAVHDVHVLADIDPGRVYVAGLSAGGAMAVILGQAYPDVFAAVGCHSGLPYRTAHDVFSALRVMREGPAVAASRSALGGVPTIVFHGDADDTVHPANADRIVQDSLGVSASTAQPQRMPVESRDGDIRPVTRIVFRNARRESCAEHWTIHGGGHAWSGGDGSVSYTDSQGPDAMAEMLRFFDGHELRPRLAAMRA